MKLLSDASEYALRAVIWLAQHPETPQKAREIARETKSAPGYLAKVLQTLTKAELLSAQRGTQGGFTLRRDPAELTVLEVLNAIDPIERIHTCPLGFEVHRDCLCPMHKQLDDALATIETSFASSTIQDLIPAPSQSRTLCGALTNQRP